MTEPWFDPGPAGGLIGAAVGLIGGLWGSLVGVLAPKGKAKGMVFGSYWMILAAGLGLLASGLYAAAAGQPWGVWYCLLLPGVITLLVVGPLGLVVRGRYRRAEWRKMQAVELE
ncbi:MAG TPA: hypothetical protein VM597_07755 [Gemmataceae bacterium]|nr:hypothetical protein [Gemmataceae bacterium]